MPEDPEVILNSGASSESQKACERDVLHRLTHTGQGPGLQPAVSEPESNLLEMRAVADLHGAEQVQRKALET